MGTLLGTLHYSHSTTTYMFNQTVGLLLGGGGGGGGGGAGWWCGGVVFGGCSNLIKKCGFLIWI